MKKIGLLLVLLSLFIAACSSGGAQVAEPEGNEEQMAATELPPTSESVEDAGLEAEPAGCEVVGRADLPFAG